MRIVGVIAEYNPFHSGHAHQLRQAREAAHADAVVAVMSGYGRDLMRVQGRRAECEYFIPNLHYWVTESLLYPFIGGDSVAGRRQKERMLPSVNMILPYVYPGYFFDVTEGSIRGLSKTALENAMQILRALEREHQRVFLSLIHI